jgi:hypothetical protein
MAGLLHPSGEPSFVELDVLGHRTQRHAAEESHFDDVREAMDADEPAMAFQLREELNGAAAEEATTRTE